MLFRILIFVLCLRIISPPLALAADDDHIAALRNMIEENHAKGRALACIHTSEMLLAIYDSALSQLLEQQITPEYGNIYGEFSSVSNFRRDVRSEINSFEKEALAYHPQSLQGIMDDFIRIDAESRRIFAKLKTLDEKIQHFIRLLGAFESRLISLDQTLAYGSKQLAWNDCSTLNLGYQIEAARGNVRSLLTVGHAMRSYFQNPREHLWTQMGIIRDRVENQYEAKATSTLDTRVGAILAKIRAQRMVESLLNKKIAWQNDIILNGWDDNYWSKYLQFGSSLVSVREKISQGETLLRNLKFLEQQVSVAEHENDIGNTLQALLDQKTRIEALGHSGAIARQFLLNKKRLEGIPQSRDVCRTKLAQHLAMEPQSQSPEYFTEIDRAYFESMEACRL